MESGIFAVIPIGLMMTSATWSRSTWSRNFRAAASSTARDTTLIGVNVEQPSSCRPPPWTCWARSIARHGGRPRRNRTRHSPEAPPSDGRGGVRRPGGDPPPIVLGGRPHRPRRPARAPLADLPGGACGPARLRGILRGCFMMPIPPAAGRCGPPAGAAARGVPGVGALRRATAGRSWSARRR